MSLNWQDAQASPSGTDSVTESFITSPRLVEVDQTMRRTLFGLVLRAIGESRDGLLSEYERERLARIRREREKKWMVMLSDVDFLLELIGKLMGGGPHDQHS